MKPIFLVILLFTINNVFGQFAVIQDKDSHVYVHKTATNGNIIDTLHNNQIIYCLWPKEDWYEVDYDKNLKSHFGFIHRSSVKFLTEFDSIYREKLTDALVVFKKDSFKIIVTKVPFVIKNNRLQYRKANEKDHVANYLEKINGKEIWGEDGGIPESQYGNIIIEINGKNIDLPKKEIENLFSPSLDNTSVNFDKTTGRLFISAGNSDAAGAYAVLWIFEKGKYKKRLILLPF